MLVILHGIKVKSWRVGWARRRDRTEIETERAIHMNFYWCKLLKKKQLHGTNENKVLFVACGMSLSSTN
jgi:hypothetical protein